jgi:signal transduction histidine kinase
LRRVTRGLRPPALDDLGLSAAVEGLARDAAVAGLEIGLDIQQLPRLDPEIEQTCFRLAQEALANVVRHSRAHRVEVRLICEGQEVVLEVGDDGQGFSADPGLGLGLVGARERAARVSGRLSVQSGKGKGTRFRAVLPLGVTS